MPSITKPVVNHPGLQRNSLGLTVRDYEGSMSTLCAGCGHDSITAALVRALWELEMPPHMIAKLSGIGCSSKTTAYFVEGGHGFNGVHGRMATLATGANAANRDLLYVGISGDGDSLSIGIGHLVHAIRRNVQLMYIIENNGVYGLTKGQFSASADVGSKAKKGKPNQFSPIDPMMVGMAIGATFLARSFSGDKEQLVPILKAAAAHRGLALIDVISPCVTFNDHEGSTKSYAYAKEHDDPVEDITFVPYFEDITVDYEPGTAQEVTMHDGSKLYLKKLEEDYDPTDKINALKRLHETSRRGEFATGLIYIEPDRDDFLTQLNVVDEPLASLPLDRVRPGPEALEEIMEGLR